MDYEQIANEARKKVLEIIWKAGTSHVGSNLSVVDIATVLFGKAKLQDQIVFSAGWKAACAYWFLSRKGILKWEDVLKTFPNPPYLGLLEPGPGVKFAGGSMGIAFSMAVGAARARKALGKKGIIYIILSDGELNCGNVWESARKVIQEGLNNVVVLVDQNGFQAMGETKEILDIQPEEMFSGWDIRKIDGHDFTEIEWVLRTAIPPTAIFAKTIKGKGVSFMEGDNSWHYRKLDKESYELATKELGQ